MRSLISIQFILLILTIGIMRSPIALADKPLTLETLFAQADQNLDVLIQTETVQQALYEAYVARADLLPSVSLIGEAVRSQDVDFNGGRSTEIDGPFTQSALYLHSEFTLFDQGRWYFWKAQQQAYERSQIQADYVKDEVCFALAIRYFQCLSHVQRVNLSVRALERGQELLDLAELLREKGVAHDIDVIRSQVKVEENRERYIDTRSRAMTLIREIRNLARLADDAGRSLQAYEVSRRNFSDMADKLVESALESRKDLQLAGSDLEQAHLLVRSAQGARMPVLSLSGDYGRSDRRLGFTSQEEWNVALALELPVFNGWRTRSQVRQSQHAANEHELRLEQLQRQAQVDVINASHRVDDNYRRLHVTNKQVLLAKLEHDLEQIRFRDGLSGSQDVVLALAKLSEAEQRLAVIELDYRLSLLELAHLSGNILKIADYLSDAGSLNLPVARLPLSLIEPEKSTP